MLAGLSALLRSRPFLAFALSLGLHLLLVGAGLLGLSGSAIHVPRRGDALFMELPDPREPAPRGNPTAPRPGPPPGRPGQRSAAEPLARPRREPPPQATQASPRVAPAPPAPAPAPVPAPAPAPTSAQTARATPEPGPAGSGPAVPTPEPEPARRPAPEPARPAPAAPPTAARPGAASETGPRIASVPPGVREPQHDIRSGLGGRGDGAGGRAEGRGGIEGEPIPLDTKDPRYSDYLEEIRRRIKSNWGFPCVRDQATRACDYRSGQLVIEFGIAKDGRVPFVQVVRSTGFAIMDDYAVNAIKLSSPFPPVPDDLAKKGLPILATFNYVVDTSLVNLLR